MKCKADGATVRATGSIVCLSEIKSWLDGMRNIHNALEGTAVLSCLEPNLNVEMSIQTGGRLLMTVDITPDHLTQRHWFEIELDQSYLPALIRDCERLLQKLQ